MKHIRSKITIDGITFGKDYQGLRSQNNGIRYFYQYPKKAKHMESDFGKFIVKIGGVVDRNDREKIVKQLKEAWHPFKVK